MGVLAAVIEPDLEPPLTRRTFQPDRDAIPDHEWVARLGATGAVRDHAIARLRELMVRAARHQVSRMPQAADLGAARRDEIVESTADDATLSVLSRLASFEGRSRFTTWAYKFGILHAGVAVRRAAWTGRDVLRHELPAAGPATTGSPEAYAEGRDLVAAVHDAMAKQLTPHQRRVATALLVDGVPIDVLAERLGTNRNALYKTLHDVRRRLRTHLSAQGLIGPAPEATP
jgi:RNA polymerase sigma-70 factor (ECF subfamily)